MKKQCSKCGKCFPLNGFCKNKGTKDGLNFWCRDCVRKYQHKNRDKIAATSASYRQDNPAKYRRYSLDYAKRYPERVNAICARRRALKRERLHQELNRAKEKEIYARARKLTKETGELHVVDHILPLSRGGWHHEQNLQVVKASLNNQKNNSLSWKHPDFKHWTELPLFLRLDILQ